MLSSIWSARIPAAAVILYAVGLMTLLLDKNLLKKIVAFDIMDTSSYLLLTSFGYIRGRLSPIIVNGVTEMEAYVNPLPAGLVLTGIVVSVSVTALMLSLTVRLYKEYHTLNVDEIYLRALEKKEKTKGSGKTAEETGKESGCRV